MRLQSGAPIRDLYSGDQIHTGQVIPPDRDLVAETPRRSPVGGDTPVAFWMPSRIAAQGQSGDHLACAVPVKVAIRPDFWAVRRWQTSRGGEKRARLSAAARHPSATAIAASITPGPRLLVQSFARCPSCTFAAARSTRVRSVEDPDLDGMGQRPVLSSTMARASKADCGSACPRTECIASSSIERRTRTRNRTRDAAPSRDPLDLYSGDQIHTPAITAPRDWARPIGANRLAKDSI